MTDPDRFLPFSAAFTFVNAATYGGPMNNTSKPANAHDVGRELLAGDPSGENIVGAHAIYGESDLLVIVKAKSPEDLITQVHTKIRGRKIGRYAYIYGSGSYPITRCFGRPLERVTFDDDGRPSAWTLATVGVPDPVQVLADGLLTIEGVELVAPVFGKPYDLFIYLKHKTSDHIQWIVDHEIRPQRHFITTTTIPVTRELRQRPV